MDLPGKQTSTKCREERRPKATPYQLGKIKELRHENYPYSFIGEKLSMPTDTVKSICRRQHIEATGPRKKKVEKQNPRICKYCLTPLVGGRKDRLFCNDVCRMKWWNTGRRIVEINP